MMKTKTNIVLPFLFAIALGCILFFQFNSYNSIRQLIGSNEELLNRMNYKNQFQLLQTHLVTFDKLVREAVITKGAVDEKEIRKEIRLIDSTMDYIDDKQPNEQLDEELYADVNELSEKLDSLVSVKIANGIEILNEYTDSGKKKAELMVYDHNKRNTNEIILKTIKDLEDLSEKKVEARVSEIDRNEKNAVLANILIAIGACLFLLLALIYIFYKIIQQQSLIQELNISKEKEEKSAKIKDDFLANMSHEIRTPLNAIVGFTSLLEKESLNEKAMKFVSTIKTSGLHLIDIVDEILDIAKLEAGMILIEHTEFNLKELIHTIEHNFKERIHEKGMVFEVDNQSTEINNIQGDEFRLTQILNNLLSNALKFTTNGKIRLVIKCINKEFSNPIIQFVVSDSGIGIPAEKIQSIFDRFEQGDHHITRKFGGTGLGLSIVKQLVELQHGTIQVVSELGKGSIFTVEIPFARLPEKELPIVITPNNNVTRSEEILRVLIVEDNRINQQLIEHWFNGTNIQYDIANDGYQALDAISNKPFDIVLMDIQMPEIDGYEVTSRIRKELNNMVPIIAMTAHALPVEKQKCIDCGMNDYLSKPISESELFMLLAKYTKSPYRLVNIEYVSGLSNGNETFIRELLEQFLIQAPQELLTLQEAYTQKEVQKVKAMAHSMKTTFGYLGIPKAKLQIFDLIENSESLSTVGPIVDEASTLYEQAESECKRILEEMSM